MAENKFVVKTVFHKDLADFGYAGLFGKGQTKVTTEIIER